MSDPLDREILNYLQSPQSRPLRPRRLARVLKVEENSYHAFRDALRQLMHEGRVVLGTRGTVVLPTQQQPRDVITGTYRHNRRGFGFVVPSDPASHEDLYIPEGENNGAITGDIVRAKIAVRGQRDGKAFHSGRILEIVERTHKRFAGTLVRQHGQWMVLPDGNTFTEVILAPDAASRHVREGTKVVIELTSWPEEGQLARGVITDILGRAGEKDVDLKGVIVQFNLPGPFPEPVLAQASTAVEDFDPAELMHERLDLTGEVICTIDPDDAKDYDDAISLKRIDAHMWELGVHIADVANFVPAGSALDLEARRRGNSCYFPGHVIPMLPEVLSNGVCSLQEGVPRLCKSVFIQIDGEGRPHKTRFANSVIRSAKRLRYREAQALIDGAAEIPHPEGARRPSDYTPAVIDLLKQMNDLARRIQKRRLSAGQLVLGLPEIELVLDPDGRVVGAREEDHSYTHTIIEMFMVEANEAVARLLDSLEVPLMRRIHPEPDQNTSERLRLFANAAGYKLPKVIDRKALQSLLDTVRGRPEAFAINLAVLKSLTRAEYSPQAVGHYALASEQYCHFTSPIRRYADLLVHRLLDSYARQGAPPVKGGRKRRKIELEDAPTYEELLELGRHISFTERRADDAEGELRKVKVLELMSGRVGEEFNGVVSGITNFGLFIQISEYLIDGLVRYEDLLDDWWDVDERGGVVRGQGTGLRIGIGDPVKARIARVDVPRRELDLAVLSVSGRTAARRDETRPADAKHKGPKGRKHSKPPRPAARRGPQKRRRR